MVFVIHMSFSTLLGLLFFVLFQFYTPMDKRKRHKIVQLYVVLYKVLADCLGSVKRTFEGSQVRVRSRLLPRCDLYMYFFICIFKIIAKIYISGFILRCAL